MKNIAVLSLILTILGGTKLHGSLIFFDNFDGETLTFNASLSNWTVSDGSVDVIGTGFFDLLPGNGNYVDLDGTSGNAAKITSNAFSFGVGQQYLLEFSLAGSQRGDTNTVQASVGIMLGVVITLQSNDPFAVYSYQFLGDGSSSAIVFDHLGGDNLGLLLDNVRLSAVPEPSSIGFLGLTISTVFVRRRAVR